MLEGATRLLAGTRHALDVAEAEDRLAIALVRHAPASLGPGSLGAWLRDLLGAIAGRVDRVELRFQAGGWELRRIRQGTHDARDGMLAQVADVVVRGPFYQRSEASYALVIRLQRHGAIEDVEALRAEAGDHAVLDLAAHRINRYLRDRHGPAALG